MRIIVAAISLLLLLGTLFTQVNPSSDKQDSAYPEKHRPQFHFSPDSMWMNDPNGMVYYEGEYHLFYQYYPDSNVWGPMHWGHAISTDLVHWEHLPIALYPDSLGYIFSGSAVVDMDNTSGLGTAGNPPLVAIYTYHDPVGEKAGRNDFQTQGIAYSTDKGRTWIKYSGNPVIPNPGIRDFRDPKVTWHEPSKSWVMIFAAGDHAKLYTSPNLKEWTFASNFGEEMGSHEGVWECPDLFPLQDQSGEEYWVILSSINPGAPNGGSGTQYFIGDFDGKTFEVDSGFFGANEEAVWLDYGRDNYAGVTWSDAPNTEKSRLFMGWMSNWQYATVVPTYRWRSAMTLPRTLEIAHTPQGMRLVSQPYSELKTLRKDSVSLDSRMVVGETKVDLPFAAAQMEAVLRIKRPNNSMERFGVMLRNNADDSFRMGYEERPKPGFFSDRKQSGIINFSPSFIEVDPFAPIHSDEDVLELHFFFDHSSVELFVNGGEMAMTEIFFPHEPFEEIVLFSEGGELEIISGEFYAFESIW